MKQDKLTFRSIRARAVVLKLRRPIVARIMTISEWPLILIDLETEEGITGRSYVGPYNAASIKYLLPVIRDFGSLFEGKPVAPAEMYERARKSLHLMGYSGRVDDRRFGARHGGLGCAGAGRGLAAMCDAGRIDWAGARL